MFLRHALAAAGVAAAAALALAPPAGAAPLRPGPTATFHPAATGVPGSWVVTLAPGRTADATGTRLVEAHGGRVERVFRSAFQGWSARMSATTASAAAPAATSTATAGTTS